MCQVTTANDVRRVNYKALAASLPSDSTVCDGNAGLRYTYRSGTGFKGTACKTMVSLRELSLSRPASTVVFIINSTANDVLQGRI